MRTITTLILASFLAGAGNEMPTPELPGVGTYVGRTSRICTYGDGGVKTLSDVYTDRWTVTFARRTFFVVVGGADECSATFFFSTASADFGNTAAAIDGGACGQRSTSIKGGFAPSIYDSPDRRELFLTFQITTAIYGNCVEQFHGYRQ